ncbi:transcription elongation factor GreA [uncultured Alsobacter sp.]|uniref:transcription elongation factor GreA n=1 Tax=uncultured Alsobacter sp. TaxID=1748258 RepID=UPI0025DE078E|nr:transcription elongation factor GreA [uncultured Alsobacter sp.]
MSRAFVKEPDGQDVFDDLPDRPLSPHPNLVTAAGLAAIEAEVARLQAEIPLAGDDREARARLGRDLRYWQHRLSSAELMHAAPDADVVHFGSTVTILREDDTRRTYAIVGEDEADPPKGKISYVSPLARALLGKPVGEVVAAGQGEAEIVAIEG